MSTENVPQDGQIKVNLAEQIAGIAAQVTVTIRTGDTGKRNELEAKLILARDQFQGTSAPVGLVPFIDVMCGLLRGEDPSILARDLPGSYHAVYEQVVDEIRAQDRDVELTVRQVLEEVARNVVLAMKRGTHDQRRMMADTLLKMHHESVRRPDLQALIDFLNATRALLQEEDTAPFENRLQGAFREKWDQILNALQE